MTQATFNHLKRRLLATVDPGNPRRVAIGPGFDSGDRMIHAVYWSSPSDPTPDGLERIGYLLVSDSISEFIPTSRSRHRRLAGIAGVIAAVALLVALLRWLLAD